MLKKTHSTFLAIVSLILVLASGSPAQELKPADPGWEQKSDEGEFRTYVRDVKGADTREVLMLGIMDATPQELFSIVGDYEHFSDFMPYIHFTRRLHSNKIDEHKTENYVFFYLSPPMVSFRYYTLKLTDEGNANGKEGAFRSQWTLEKGEYRRTPDHPDIREHINKGYSEPVETAFNEGYWLFEPRDNGKSTRVSYYVWTNPGGSIPLWVANKANTVALPELWKALKKRLEWLRRQKKTSEPVATN